MNSENILQQREQDVLRSIVNLYILQANPIGSRRLSKFLEDKIKLSPATLRNVMADLEEMNYIDHPHTSAGRIPTDKGYRFYVDALKNVEKLTNQELKLFSKIAEPDDSEQALKEAGKILTTMSRYLSIVRIPHVKNLIVQKIELIPISETRVLVVIALDSRIIRHVTLEAEFSIKLQHIDKIRNYINEKVSGQPLQFIRENFEEIISDFDEKSIPLVRLFIDSVDNLFHSEKTEKILTAGTTNLLDHPEFDDLNRVRSIVEFVEDKDMVIHLLDSASENEKTQVLIGSESGAELLEDYSIVLSKYKIGSAKGSIGLIGPKRMNYGKMIAMVDAVSKVLGSE